MSARARKLLAIAAVAGAVVPVLAFSFGGWAVVTVENLPEYVVAGKTVELPFTVRQHGQTLLSGLPAKVTAIGPRARDTIEVTPRSVGSRYIADLTLPGPGAWAITIHSGFGPIANTLAPITVVADESVPHAVAPAEERGFRLYIAKGCVMCHVRGEIASRGMMDIGPILTGRQYPPQYLAAFLADPEKSPLSKATVSQWRMPTLGLKPEEITALVAFINSSGAVASQSGGGRP